MKALIILAAIATFGFGCSQKPSNIEKKLSESHFASRNFSGSFKNTPHFIAFLKLREPALLSKAKFKNGAITYNSDHLDRINLEQEETLKSLKDLSPSIRVIYRYRLVLNALAVLAPQDLAPDIEKLNVNVILDQRFKAPKPLKFNINKGNKISLKEKNSTSFIGSKKVFEKLGLNGKGTSIGIIDSGIDYTHKAFGGTGSVVHYKSIVSDRPNRFFPNKRVVGGKDFVGKKFSTSSIMFETHVPTPDDNPIDLTGHGTHVAGSAAGLGDGVNTYDGVAPGAELYALKVFGDGGVNPNTGNMESGGTSDTAIIAAFEYAADPNGDLDLTDRLDVVNLSLGSSYGDPHNMYNLAIQNLIKGGTVVVAAAGNAGVFDYITSSPGTSTGSISVAASLDDMDHNHIFPLITFESKNLDLFTTLYYAEAASELTKSLSEFESVESSLYYIGIAKDSLTTEQELALKGRIALIDRGSVTFSEKIGKAAQAGAIAVVVVNNEKGKEPIQMGSSEKKEKFNIPAIMISFEDGEDLKEALGKTEDLTVNLKSGLIKSKPELIDSLTLFSSKGPRAFDSILKPEIAAPGGKIISAKLGSGDQGKPESGTSMSSPHVAGAVAIMRQAYPKLSAASIKALMMNTAKPLSQKDGTPYSLSRQGSGRIQIYEAVTGGLVVQSIDPETKEKSASWSLGEVQIGIEEIISRKTKIRNLLSRDRRLTISIESKFPVRLVSSKTILVPSGETRTPNIRLSFKPGKEVSEEIDGYVVFKEEGKAVARIPFLAVISHRSNIFMKDFKSDIANGFSEFTLKNSEFKPGKAYVFNLIALDKRKSEEQLKSLTYFCDIQSAGYRVVEKQTQSGKEDFLEFAIKTYNPLNTWRFCQIEINFGHQQIIAKPTQTLVGLPSKYLVAFGLKADDPGALGSVMIDNQRYRAAYAMWQRKRISNPKAPLDLSAALDGLGKYDGQSHSTLAILSIPWKSLRFSSLGEIYVSIKMDYENAGGSSDMDMVETFMIRKDKKSLFHGMPVVINLKAGSKEIVRVNHGTDLEKRIVVYVPNNRFEKSPEGLDDQMILTPESLLTNKIQLITKDNKGRSLINEISEAAIIEESSNVPFSLLR